MSLRLLAVMFDARDPVRVARFWAGLLDRDVVDTSRGTLLPGDINQLGLGFAAAAAERAGPNRMHLHLTSASRSHQERTVARALDLGAHHLDVGQRPEEGHVVLADPGGNEFCVIPPDSSFLAGCGVVGELACDGSRDVGLFWSEALGWPLVWDRDGETAVQSPEGGTKISWGGPPVAPHVASTRQRLALVTTRDERGAEVDRLLALGAASRGTAEQDVLLVDPDGNEFHVFVQENWPASAPS